MHTYPDLCLAHPLESWTLESWTRKLHSFEIFPAEPFCSSFPPRRMMPTKILPWNKSSRRRLNTGSVSNSRQEATPASGVGPSTSSTPSVSLRGDAKSAEVSSSLSGQTIMDMHGTVVPSPSSLVEPRINKRGDRSSIETSDGRADTSRGNPSSDRENPSPDRGNPSTTKGNPSNNNRGNPSDQESPADFLDNRHSFGWPFNVFERYYSAEIEPPSGLPQGPSDF